MTEAGSQVANNERVERLERRLERERSARLEAESIAERGMRDLFLANRDLDRRIAERTAELEAARAEAVAASRARAHMLAWLSRHVRAPLNGVIGMLELLGDQATTPQAQAWVESASTSADGLLRIFSRLILFVELEDDRDRQLSSVDISVLAGEVRQRWARPAISSGKLLLVEDFTPTGTTVDCVQSWMERLIDEIVDNAVRHAVPGPLRVEFQTLDGRLQIDITDAGPGMDDPERLMIVETDLLEAGKDVGMGFPLVSQLAEALGAAVTVTSTPTQPTTVRIDIPLG